MATSSTSTTASALIPGYAPIEVGAPRRRLILSVEGLEKEGKTNFALTAPGPIGYMDYDVGLEGVVEKFLKGGHMGQPAKTIYRRTNKDGSPNPYRSRHAKKAEAEAEWERFETDYYKLLGAARSTIVDTGSAAWELKRLAAFGKLTQVMPHHYVGANDEFRQLVNDAYDGHSNLIFLHKRKAEWKEGKDGKGQKTGNFERSGFAEMGFLVQANLVAYRLDPNAREFDGDLGFRLYIRDCRQNPELSGMTLMNDMITFQNLAMLIEPDSDPAEWE
jgi:hypothetical protein